MVLNQADFSYENLLSSSENVIVEKQLMVDFRLAKRLEPNHKTTICSIILVSDVQKVEQLTILVENSL